MLEDGSIPLSKLEEMPVTATPDWNQNDANADDYIIGRTHYVEVVETSTNVLEWDGNTEGLVTVFPGLYKMSDVVLEASDLIDAIVAFNENGVETLVTLSEENINDLGLIISAASDTIYIVKEDNTNFAGMIFPEAGIYFLNIEPDGAKVFTTKLEVNNGSFPFTLTSETVHKLDEKYLPDGLLTQSNLATDSEAMEDIAELGLVEVMHHDGTVYYDATGKILTYWGGNI